MTSAPSVPEALMALGVNDDVRSFVSEVTDRILCLVGETSARHYVRLVGADLSQTALYVHKGFVSIALPVDTSARWERATGASVQQKPATHYLLVRERQFQDTTARAGAVHAAVFSVGHYREVHIGVPGEPGHADIYRATCPACFAELSVIGKCFCSDD